MTKEEIVQILRNPYGLAGKKIREAALAAADLIEFEMAERQAEKEWLEANKDIK